MEEINIYLILIVAINRAQNYYLFFPSFSNTLRNSDDWIEGRHQGTKTEVKDSLCERKLRIASCGISRLVILVLLSFLIRTKNVNLSLKDFVSLLLGLPPTPSPASLCENRAHSIDAGMALAFSSELANLQDSSDFYPAAFCLDFASAPPGCHLRETGHLILDLYIVPKYLFETELSPCTAISGQFRVPSYVGREKQS